METKAKLQYVVHSCLQELPIKFLFSLKVDYTPNGRSPRKRLIFAALCNDLMGYFIVCFEHQCNTMRAV